MQEDVSKELLFVQSLEKVRRIAKEQGNRIREAQVKEEFSGLDLNETQMGMIFDYLAKHRIACGKPEGSGGLSEESSMEESSLKESFEEELFGKESIGEESLEDEFLTEKEKDYLQTYLEEIALLPVRDDKELEADTILALAGDMQAQHRLMESFLKNVVDIAKLYSGQGVLLEDLIGEGNIALAAGLKTLGSMDVEERPSAEEEDSGKIPGGKAAKVQGVLARQVMDAMEELIRRTADCEKVDKKAAEQVNMVADKARALAEELRRKVTPQELAGETGLSVKAIQDAMRMSGYKIEDIAMEYL